MKNKSTPHKNHRKKLYFLLFFLFDITLRLDEDVTQGQFLNEAQLVWIPSLPSPRVVA